MTDLCTYGDGTHLNARILRFIGSPFALNYMSLICNLVNYYFINCLSFVDSKHWKHLVLWFTSNPPSLNTDQYPKAWGPLLSQNSSYWSQSEHMTEVRHIIYYTLSPGNEDLPRDGHKTDKNLSKYPRRGFLTRVEGSVPFPPFKVSRLCWCKSQAAHGLVSSAK